MVNLIPMMAPKSRLCSYLGVLLLCAVSGTPMSAQIWLGSGVGDTWSEGANWGGGASPSSGATTALSMDNDGSGSSDHDLGAFTLNSLTFGSGLTGPFTLIGDSLIFAGTAPSLIMNSDFGVSVSNDIGLSVDTTFTGTGSGTLAISGDLSGTGLLSIDGSNFSFESNTNSYSGGTVINSGGSLLIDRSTGGSDITIAATGSSALGTGTIEVAGGSLLLDADDDLTFARALTVSSGTATIRTDDDLTFSGAVTQADGLLRLENNGAGNNLIIVNGVLDLDGGTFQADGGDVVTNAAIVIDGATLDFDANDIIDINQAVTLNSGTVDLRATNDVILDGDITVETGTFSVFDGGGSGDDIFVRGGLALNGGTFTVDGEDSTFTGDVVIDGGDLVGFSDTDIDFGGGLQLISGNINLTPADDVNFLAGALVDIDGGTFDITTSLGTNNNITMNAASVFDIDGGVLDFNAGSVALNGTLAIDGASLDIDSSNVITFGGTGNTVTIGSSAAANVILDAESDVNFNAALTVTDGTLTVTDGEGTRDDINFNSTVVLESAATVTLTAEDITLNGDFTSNGATVVADSDTDFEVFQQFTVNGGSFTVNADDDFAVAASGTLRVDDGVLDINTLQGSGNNFGMNVNSSLDLNGGLLSIDAFNVAFGGATVDDADLIVNSANVTTFRGTTINNTGGEEVSVDSVGVLTLSDDFTVIDGKVDLTSAADVNVGPNDTLRVDGGEVTISAGPGTGFDFNLNGTGDLDVNGGQISISGDDANFSGQVAVDSGSLTVNAAVNINQTNIWNVTSGSVDLSSGNRTRLNSTLNLDASASFRVSAGDLLIDGGATVDGQAGASHGTITLVEDLIVDNATLLNTPNITIEAAADNQIRAQAGSRFLTGVGTLTIDSGSATTTLASSISNLSAVEIDVSSGTFLLSADNRIDDSTTVNLSGGTFASGGNDEVVSNLTLTANSVIDFAGGPSTLDFAGTSTSAFSGSAILYIDNWDGDFEFGGGNSQLLFTGGGNSGIQSQIIFRNPAGFAPGEYVGILIGDEIVPIPEPATYLTGIGLLLLLFGWGYIRRR